MSSAPPLHIAKEDSPHGYTVRRCSTPVQATVDQRVVEEVLTTPLPSESGIDVERVRQEAGRARSPILKARPIQGGVVLSPPAKKKGRPITTREGVGIRERKKEEALVKKERAAERLFQEASAQVEGGLLAARKKGDPAKLVPEGDDPDAVRLLPFTDLAAGVVQCLGAITLIGKKSGNLQGRLQGVLNWAVNNIALAITTLTARLNAAEGDSDSSSKLMEKMRELRAEVKASKAETESIRVKLRRLQQQQQTPSLIAAATPPLPPSLPPLQYVGEASFFSKGEWPTPKEAGNRRRNQKRGAILNSSLPLVGSVPSTMEVDIRTFDDELAQEEAGPPVGLGVPIWRPSLLGKQAKLVDFIPGVQQADRGKFMVLTEQILSRVGQVIQKEEGSSEMEALLQKMDALKLQREALKGRHAQMDVPTPAPRAAKPHPADPAAAAAAAPLASPSPPQVAY